MTTGAVSGEVSGSSGNQNQLLQEPPKVTPERECIGFMKYVAENGRARSFSTAPEWLILSLLAVDASVQSQVSAQEREQSVLCT